MYRDHVRAALAGCVLALGACGAELPDHSRTQGVVGPDELHALVLEFVESTGAGVGLSVRLASPAAFPDGTVGLCFTPGDGYRPWVMLNSDFWYRRATPTQKWMLVFHEMGHCALGLDHDPRVDPDQCPASPMWWEISTTSACVDAGKRTRAQYVEALGSAPPMRVDDDDTQQTEDSE